MTEDNKVRLDKWLWAARFFKTRAVAAAAIDAGHVSINGQRAKRASAVKEGDRLNILATHGRFDVRVLLPADKRVSADLARAYYAETPESVAARERDALAAKMAPAFDHADISGRPTKKWRRQLDALNERK
ncbi:RNA-binding S4 domain-containing protein [Chitinibacteraceae bacterium HSL-7]